MAPDTPTYVTIDTARLRAAIRERGFDSVQNLAEELGLHRNTVGNYLSGNTALPRALDQILRRLRLDPAAVLQRRTPPRRQAALKLEELLAELQAAEPPATFVMFGSRARETAKPYSDYDLGVFYSQPRSFARHSRLLDLVGEWNERQLTTVQLTELTHADPDFLERIREDLVFLAGSFSGWCDLLRRTGVELDE